MPNENESNGAPAPEPAGKAEVVRMAPGLAVPDEKLVDEYLSHAATTVDDDPDRIADSIVGRILRAESVEDVLAPQAIEHARDLVGHELEIRSAKFQRSDFETGGGVYMICEAEVLDEERTTTFSCGGRSVMAQVYRVAQLGGLPFQAVLKQAAKPTKQGFYPLWLESLGPRDRVSGVIDRAKDAAPA